MKRIIVCLAFFGLFSCQSEELYFYQENGYAQGSTYHISYRHPAADHQASAAFDSIFKLVDRSVNTYQKSSLISHLNAGDTLMPDPVMDSLFKISRTIYRASAKAFDPTVGPLVNFWGFGPDKNRSIDSSQVDSLKSQIGFEYLDFTPGKRFHLPAGFSLDFNAVAQGYTVDLIADYLESEGVKNYMVEVGGEVKCKGRNRQEEVWRIGVDKPTEQIDQQDRFQFILKLDNRALATSGNYRKFWTDPQSGVRYAHTIDPRSGYPAKNTLLSVSIISKEAATADALATAVMVLGKKEGLDFLAQWPEPVECYLISSQASDSTWEVYQSEGFEEMILNPELN